MKNIKKNSKNINNINNKNSNSNKIKKNKKNKNRKFKITLKKKNKMQIIIYISQKKQAEMNCLKFQILILCPKRIMDFLKAQIPLYLV